MLSVFLSHSHSDEAFTRRLSEALQAHGIHTWLDEAEIRVGDSLIQKIEVAIRDCTYLAVVLSPESVQSEWVRKEVEIALNQEIHGRRVKVLPLLHKPCELPLFLVGKLYADFSRDFQTGFVKLIARLNSDLVDSSHQVPRVRESFLSDYQRWVTFNRHPQYLLEETTLARVLDAVPACSISVDLLEFIFSGMCRIACGSAPIKSQWIRWLDEIPDSTMVAVFERVFDRGGPNVRAGAAKISALLRVDATATIESRLFLEKDAETKRRLVQSLVSKRPVWPELAATLEHDNDWVIQMYAAKLRRDRTSALLISDGTIFSAGLARIADSAGFRVVSAPGILMPRLTEDICEYDVLSVPVLIILVRGEHYSDYGHDDFYSRLRKYVTSGGHLFATSWTAWENRNDGPLLAVLPFKHVRESYHEDEIVSCSAVKSTLKLQLFPPVLTFRSSFEILEGTSDSVALCEMSSGVPLFGYRREGSGVCYYLNSCQHSCAGQMASPLESSELRGSIEHVFTWIARSCSASNHAR